MRLQTHASALICLPLATLFTLSACGGGKVASASSSPPDAAPTNAQVPPTTLGLSARQRYQLALSLLQQGDDARARAELAVLRRDNPSDGRVVMLLREIDTDPKTLYGADSFAYQLRAGDTLFSLAKQFLHDPLQFYGLARFNDIKLPAELQPGQTIMIPGRARAPERPAPVRRARAAAPSTPAAVGKAAATPTPVAAESDAKRDQARSLRRQGLDQMSAGSIDRAVTLLSQAASLDPQNSAIGADLARARRVQAAVHSH